MLLDGQKKTVLQLNKRSFPILFQSNVLIRFNNRTQAFDLFCRHNDTSKVQLKFSRQKFNVYVKRRTPNYKPHPFSQNTCLF